MSATSTSARCAGPTWISWDTSTTSCTSTTSRRRGSTCSAPMARPQTGELAEGVVVVRHEVHYTAPLTLPVPAGEDRVLGHRDPGCVLHDGLRGLPGHRRRRGGRRVYLRATTVLTPYVFATERPRRLVAGREARRSASSWSRRSAGPGRQPTPARHEKVGHYPVHVRFSDVDVYGHVNNVKYFEFFQEARILMMARLWRDVPDGPRRTLVRGRPDRRRLPAADPVPAGAVRRVVVDLARRRAVAGDRVRDLRRRHRAVASPRGPGLLRPRAPSAPTRPPTSTASGCWRAFG